MQRMRGEGEKESNKGRMGSKRRRKKLDHQSSVEEGSLPSSESLVDDDEESWIILMILLMMLMVTEVVKPSWMIVKDGWGGGGGCGVKYDYSLQAFSSDPSVQSGDPLQKSSFSMQSPFPQANFPVSHMGSSVARRGVASRGSNSSR